MPAVGVCGCCFVLEASGVRRTARIRKPDIYVAIIARVLNPTVHTQGTTTDFAVSIVSYILHFILDYLFALIWLLAASALSTIL